LEPPERSPGHTVHKTAFTEAGPVHVIRLILELEKEENRNKKLKKFQAQHGGKESRGAVI
jgi:hypothetical protein